MHLQSIKSTVTEANVSCILNRHIWSLWETRASIVTFSHERPSWQTLAGPLYVRNSCINRKHNVWHFLPNICEAAWLDGSRPSVWTRQSQQQRFAQLPTLCHSLSVRLHYSASYFVNHASDQSLSNLGPNTSVHKTEDLTQFRDWAYKSNPC